MIEMVNNTNGISDPVKVHLVAAARPNFMKVAPLYHALKQERWCVPILVHTGQHYDSEMSDVFLRDLGLPAPDIHLGVGSGTHSEQTAAVMVAYEKACMRERPDWVVVVGDVNSTLACTLVAKKLCISVAHLEAGLRSGDRAMPEEINRIATDALADVLWTPSPDANENLRREGVAEERIQFVGNIMMDSYEFLREKITAEKIAVGLGFEPRRYGVVTLHRPSNVDDAATLGKLVQTLCEINSQISLVFPIHPRTRQRLQSFGLIERLIHAEGIRLLEPLGYVRFMSLVQDAALVITDSGGIQEETTYLGIPCLTLRNTTERPITITQGTNRLVSPETVVAQVRESLCGNLQTTVRPQLWDGRTAGRVVASLQSFCAGSGVARGEGVGRA